MGYTVSYRAYLSLEYFPVTLAPRYYSIYPTALSTHLRRKRCDKKSRYCCHSSSPSRTLPPLPPPPFSSTKKPTPKCSTILYSYSGKERPAPVRYSRRALFAFRGISVLARFNSLIRLNSLNKMWEEKTLFHKFPAGKSHQGKKKCEKKVPCTIQVTNKTSISQTKRTCSSI